MIHDTCSRALFYKKYFTFVYAAVCVGRYINTYYTHGTSCDT